MGNYHLKILKIVDETDDVRSFYVEKPESFIFSPGQYCLIGSRVLPHEFSPMAIASGIKEDFLLFTVRKWGEVSTELFKLNEGDILVVSGPHGTALPLTDFMGSKILCIAGGTGLTPIRSLMHSIDDGMITTLYGTKNESNILYREELKSWDAKIIYEEGNPKGLVTDLIDEKSHDYAFVVGPSPMIKASLKKLRENGWSEEEIFVSLEKFVYGQVFGPIYPFSELYKLQEYLGTILS